jgi:subtilase family serine protease
LQAEGIARPDSLAALSYGPAGGYTPAQIAKAYGLNPNATTNQTVAIVDAYDDPSVLDDLNAFDTHYGLPTESTSSFKVVGQTGGAVPATTDVGWAAEITLDVQAVRGLCHKCKILLVEADDNHNPNLGAAVNYAAAHAKIVSNSYGGAESVGSSSNYNHPGVAILASTGDDGWYSWDWVNVGGTSSNKPNTPASFNTVIGVGGTSLYLNSDSTRQAETVWNDNGSSDVAGYAIGQQFATRAGATGGGCSTLSSPRPWQQKVAGYGGLGCGATLRDGVDIAAVADSFTGYDIYQTTGSWCASGGQDGNGNTCPSADPGWQTYGGTSLASPVVAAMWALAGGPAGVKYPALSLYGHFKSDATHPLYDVTFGGNGACDTGTPGACGAFFGPANPNQAGDGLVDCLWGATGTATLANHYQCYARSGYDGVSGVGAPKGVNAFRPMAPRAVIKPPGTVTHGKAHTFSAAGSSSPFPGGVITKYVWNWGDGHTTTTTTATASHKYATKGKRKITLRVSDTYTSQNNGRTGTRSITITVQ